MANKIKLNDPKYIRQLFVKKLAKFYPDIKGFKTVNIYPIKRSNRKNYFHFVNYYSLKNDNNKKINIIGSANSDGTKKEIFKTLKYIYPFFKEGKLISVKPLFYQAKHKAMFYEAIKGPNLFAWLKNKQPVKDFLPDIVDWLVKLHQLPPMKNLTVCKFDEHTFDPTLILNKRTALVKKHKAKVRKHLKLLLLRQPKLSNKMVFTHGDLHPENVMIADEGKKIAIIDFSNVCLFSPAFDVGSFMLQVEFMASFFYPKKEAASFAKIFLDNYLKKDRPKNKKQFFNELAFFQAWIALKGMLYCLAVPDPKRATHFEELFLKLMNIK